jgi:hypothetical protein
MYWNSLKGTMKTMTNTFGSGVNTFLTPLEIADGELTDCLNVCSDRYPAICTRPDRIPLSSAISSTVCNGLGGYASTSLMVLDGIFWKRWDAGTSNYVTISSSLSSTEGNFQEFAGGTFRRALMCNSSQHLYWDGSTSSTAINISSDTNMPFTKLFAVHKGRIYALASNNVSFCGLNNSTDWTTANDAGLITVTKSIGTGTAIFAFSNHVIIWSLNSMHELYGTGPSDYELIDVTGDIGCVGQKTICEVNGKLFWLDFTGIYQYTGGTPQKISNKVQKWISGINWTYKDLICAGSKNNKLYMSIPYGSTQNNLILVYDTAKDIWDIQDGNFNHCTNINDTLYASQTTSGRVWNMESTARTGADNGTAISWNFETKAYNEGVLGRHSMGRMFVTHEGSSSATMGISYTSNAGSTNGYVSLVASSDVTIDSETEIHESIIPGGTLSNLDFYKLKFSGTGNVAVHSVHKNMRIRER